MRSRRSAGRERRGSVKHAGVDALDDLEPLLTALRTIGVLKEKKRGTFYRGGRAFLHFHEDSAGLFADVRLAQDFERIRVSTADEQARLLERVRTAVDQPASGASA